MQLFGYFESGVPSKPKSSSNTFTYNNDAKEDENDEAGFSLFA